MTSAVDTPTRSRESSRARVERPVLPLDHALDHLVGDRGWRSSARRSRRRRPRPGAPGPRRWSNPWPTTRSTSWSTPDRRRLRLATVLGSKVASRSRGTLISTGPTPVNTVVGRCPLREFPPPRPDEGLAPPFEQAAPSRRTTVVLGASPLLLQSPSVDDALRLTL